MKRSQKKTRNTKATPASIHGVLVDVYGVGALLLGPSGIGKSECALDLVTRGHRLVSDDLVLVSKNGKQLYGEAPQMTRAFLEVRGLGILNVRDLYGAASIREKKGIDIVIELVPIDSQIEFERLGVEYSTYALMGLEIPFLRVPFWLGRNVTTLIEVAAKNQILRWSGKNSALEFEKRHQEGQCGPS